MKTTLLKTTKCWFLTVLTCLFITSQVHSSTVSVKFSHVEVPKMYMESATWMPQISISEPCTCLNNGSGQALAQFSERVLISGESDENWVVVNATGLYHDGASVPPGPSDEVIAGDIFLVDGMDPTSYYLDVVHVDGIGYELEVTNGIDTLSIENRCYYPQPQINLSDNYCINHPPINMIVTAPPYSGVYSIEVNGMPTNTFDPAALGVGTHEVVYTFTADYLNDSMPGCEMTLSREIEVTPNYIGGLACTNINISLGSGGFTIIDPDMLLMGDYGCSSTFLVDILGKDTDTVWCSDIGQTYMVKVTDPVRNNTCWGNVYVEDKQPPTILCADTVIFCGTDFFNLPFSDFIQVSDNCDPDFTLILLNQSPFNNPSCHPDYSASIVRTYRATDKYGNSSVCTHTIYFDRQDLEDIEAPADTTLQCDQAMDLSPENLGFPHVDGNEIGFFCEFSITHNDFSFTTCPGSRMIKRTFWVTDICTREMVSLTQVINIVDDEAPEIVCPQDVTILNTPGQCSGIYNFPQIAVSDNCVEVNQITVFRFVNGIPVPPGVTSVVVPVGENLITIWAQDPCLNLGVCNFNVTVMDVEGPSMACNPITVGLNAEGIIVVTIDSLDNFYFDNCGLSDTLIARMDEMVFGESVIFTCDDIGRNQIILVQVTDLSGNSNTCMVGVEVQDKLGPNIVYCPASFQVECNVEEPDLDDEPIFEDNCDPNPTVFPASSLIPGCCDSYTIFRSWLATDNMGNTSICEQTIEVSDTTPPVVECESEYTVYLDDSGEGTVVVDDIYFGATDICCDAPLEPDFTSQLFTCSDLFTTQFIVISVTDECDNTGTCEVAITVLDTITPQITVCPDVTINASEIETCDLDVIADYLMSEILVAEDNCDTDPQMSFEGPENILEFICDGTPGVYIGDLRFGVSDASGNSNTSACILTLTYNYDIAPDVTLCVEDITLTLDENGEAILYRIDVFEAEHVGYCVGIQINYNVDSVLYTCDDIGPNMFEFVATQTCTILSESSVSCTVNITIEDDEPVIICPTELTLALDENGEIILDETVLGISASDYCGDITYEFTPESFTCDDIGMETVFVIVSDESGSTAFCSISVTIVDIEDPVVICPGNINTVNDTGECGAIVNYTMPVGSDNCEIDTVTANFASGAFFPVGPNVVTITAEDPSGNTGTCTFVINVFDTESPTVNCSNNRSVLCSANIEQELANFTFTATDNCGEENLILDTIITYNIGACGAGNITLVFEATDGAGLSANCNRTLTISMDPNFELELGFIDFPDDVTLSCGEDSSPTNTGFPEEVRQLACAELEFDFDDIVSNMPSGCMTITRTWTVTDTCSMTMVNSDQIIVISNVQPIFSFVPGDITVFASADSCETNVILQPALGAACAEDITISNDYNLGGGDASGIYPIGTTVVTFTITNACGNTATASVSVTLEDNTAPVVGCPEDQTMSCLTDINDFAEAQNYIATDACGIAITSINTQLISGDCGEEIYEVEFTATDSNGNVSACTYGVQAIPTYLEEGDIVWPVDVTISCNEDTTTIFTGVPTYPITCSDLEISYVDSDVIIIPDTCNRIDRTWTIRDLCIYDPFTGDGEYTYIQAIYLPDYSALFAMVEQGIEIEEETHPDSCSKYIEFEYVLPAFCASDVVISNSQTAGGSDASDIYPVGETIVHFTIENVCEIIFEDSIIIRVFDNTSPRLNCGIPFLTVTCADDIETIIEDWPLVVVEACDYTVNINSLYSLNNCGVGTIVTTYTVSDGSNNQAACNVTLTVESDTQQFDPADIIWPATPIELTDCAADISPSALNSFPESLNPYLCLGLEFLFEDVELTPEGVECRRVERTWYAYSNCTDDTLATFIQLIIIDENNFSPIVISGFIFTENAEPIPFTDLYIPQIEMHATANMEGHYELQGMMPKENLMLIPSNEVSSPYDGVTVADIKEINKYIYGKRRTLSPYQIIAADVDRNGVIDDDDAQILRELILGIRGILPISQWRYVDNDYKFLNPKNPLMEDFPETKFVSMTENDEYKANFVGVKMGDVNNSYKSGIGLRDREELFIWTTPNKSLQYGSWNELPVYTNESPLLESYQFTMHIGLEVGEQVDIVPSNKGEFFWYEKEDEPGVFAICWFKGEDEVMDINDPVFTIRWFALQNGYLDDKIHISSDKTIAKQYMSDQRKGQPVFAIEQAQGLSYALHQNEPNPFMNQTFVPYQIPEDMEVMISIFDSYGKQVYSIKEYRKAGMGKMNLDLSNLQQDGVYYYRMDAGTFSATKKMIKLN